MWWLYELLILIGLLVYIPRAIWRRRLPHRGWSMRLGRYPRSVVESLRGRRSLWVHAVSVGEVLAVQPLLHRLAQAYPENQLVLSTITPGGFAIASTQLATLVTPVYFPLDLRPCVRRALDTFQPRILLLMESELWPAVIHATSSRHMPIVVMNGRISSRAFKRYHLMQPWLGRLLKRVDLFLMQSQMDVDRILQLGAPTDRVKVVGSLKWDASIGSRPSAEAIQATAAQVGLGAYDRVLVAGSTHRGEEAEVLRAFLALRGSYETLRLMLAPRHLERVAEVESLVRQAGLKAVRLSHGANAGRWEVGIVDTYGRLPYYYGLATIVFIGGSLIPHGGQNPLEATSLGKPVVFGSSMENFQSIAHQLLAHHAARQLTSGEEATALFNELLANPTETQAMGRRAQEVTERFQGATQRTLDALKPLLNQQRASP